MQSMSQKYKEQIRGALKKELALSSVQQVPVLQKVVLNMCVPAAVKNPKILGPVSQDLSLIAGQKAVITKAKKAISNFKIKKGQPLGAVVTLRRDKMWRFMERLVHFSLPQVRDFRGLSPKGFDGQGNYSMGIKEQIIFPEVDYDKVDAIRGLNITICIQSAGPKQSLALLKHLGMPFRKN